MARGRLHELVDSCACKLRRGPPDDAEERPAALRAAVNAGRGGARKAGRPRLATDDDDLVFVGEQGSYVDGSALRRRYMNALAAAGLRPLRFHDLRHTFGTRMIAKADILRVKEWMGHAEVQTTMRYLHYVPRPDDARLVDEAFELENLTALSASVDGCAAPRSRHRGQADLGGVPGGQALRTSVSHASTSLR